MAERMSGKRSRPWLWPLGAVLVSVLLLAAGALVTALARPRVSPNWLVWPLAVVYLGIGTGLGLGAARLAPLRHGWWLWLTQEAIEHQRRQTGGSQPPQSAILPDELVRVPDYPPLRYGILWLLAVAASVGGAGAIEWLVTGKSPGAGPIVSFIGFNLGLVVIPHLRARHELIKRHPDFPGRPDHIE